MKYPAREIDHRLQGFPTWPAHGFHLMRATHVLVTGRIKMRPKPDASEERTAITSRDQTRYGMVDGVILVKAYFSWSG